MKHKQPSQVVFVGVGLLLLLALLPAHYLILFPCVPARFLGFDCPGCGLLRSGAAFFRGHWLESVRLYPLGPVFFIGVLLYVLDELRLKISQHTSRPWVKLYGHSAVPHVGLAMMILQWIAKLMGVW